MAATGRPDGSQALIRGARCLAAALGALLMFSAARCPAVAQVPAVFTNQLSITSISGQFIVHGKRPEMKGLAPLKPAKEGELIELDPRTAAISCERIKKAALEMLGAQDAWRGKVHVFIDSANKPNQPFRIAPDAFADGWQWRVYVSEKADWQRFVRVITEVLLMELANRPGGRTFTPVPLWLVEGLSGLMGQAHGASLVTSPYSVQHKNERRPDPLAFARVALASQEPLDFTGLSQPDAARLGEGSAWTNYLASAHLFTQALLQDRTTHSIPLELTIRLRDHLNWQTAFLKVSNGRFLSMLEVEKWWAMVIVQFRESAPGFRWPAERVLARLASILVEPATITGASGRPETRSVPLADVITTWTPAIQDQVLRRKSNQLAILAAHSPPELAPFVREYQRAIDRLIASRTPSGQDASRRGDVSSREAVSAREATRKLEILDRQRLAMAGRR